MKEREEFLNCLGSLRKIGVGSKARMTDDDVRYVGLGDDTTSHNDTFLRLFMTMTPKIDDDKKCTAFSLILSPVIHILPKTVSKYRGISNRMALNTVISVSLLLSFAVGGIHKSESPVHVCMHICVCMRVFV